MKSIVLGGGCFWCTEAVFQRVKGVSEVLPGYAGGKLLNPTYHNMGSHAEVVRVTYDPDKISLEKLLEIFFAVHDPTQVNRQGNDIGKQYRSIVLTNDYIESRITHEIIDGIRALWDNPIVTEVNLLDKFYPAEEYHQDYFNKNPQAGYCQVIINPKLEKFRKKFKDYLA